MTTYKLVAEIDSCPQSPEQQQDFAGRSVTVGDLDGNTLRLLHLLVSSGCAEINGSTWKTLLDVYQQETLTEQNFDSFKKALYSLTVNREQTPSLVRLIGDTLADREGNDALTVLVYKWLHEKKIPFELLISNHDMVFFLFMCQEKLLDYRPPITNTNSLLYFQIFIITDQENDKPSKLYSINREIVLNNIIPHIKLFSYEYNKNNKKLSIYSHAPTSILTIERAAKKFGVGYNEGNYSVEDLIRIIDQINNFFVGQLQRHYKSGNQAELSDFFEEKLWREARYESSKGNPIARAAWARSLSEKEHNSNIDFASRIEAQLTFHHGHLGPTEVQISYSKNSVQTDAALRSNQNITYNNMENWKGSRSKEQTFYVGQKDAILSVPVEDAAATIVYDLAPNSQNNEETHHIRADSLESDQERLRINDARVITGLWLSGTVVCAALPIIVPVLLGSTLLAAAALMWPVSVGIVVISAAGGMYYLFQKGNCKTETCFPNFSM